MIQILEYCHGTTQMDARTAVCGRTESTLRSFAPMSGAELKCLPADRHRFDGGAKTDPAHYLVFSRSGMDLKETQEQSRICYPARSQESDLIQCPACQLIAASN